ncbi:hypothetical protein [Ruegeria sp. A3M17]|uniref:hypothetical protein n=1 Tax=Ruegeria sp. A3M17 TaxID=2267229 RepID=UPI000DE86F46|nr:hypothetical protein [Ruegeria sp. A3M17]RBW53865.1 hypothetical protein DS906_18200 [Ruegeria sp. A3M17]
MSTDHACLSDWPSFEPICKKVEFELIPKLKELGFAKDSFEPAPKVPRYALFLWPMYYRLSPGVMCYIELYASAPNDPQLSLVASAFEVRNLELTDKEVLESIHGDQSNVRPITDLKGRTKYVVLYRSNTIPLGRVLKLCIAPLSQLDSSGFKPHSRIIRRVVVYLAFLLCALLTLVLLPVIGYCGLRNAAWCKAIENGTFHGVSGIVDRACKASKGLVPKMKSNFAP